MNFANLIIAAFFAGLGLGYTKFYFLGYLSNQIYSPGDKVWIIQCVGAIITFGPVMAYAFSGPLATALKKSVVMRYSGLATAVFTLIGFLLGWPGGGWLYVFAAGFIMGIFNPAKNASVPLEAACSGRSTEATNAILGIVYIVGLLIGVPAATALYLRNPSVGAVIAVGVFAAAAFFGGRCRYPAEEGHLRPFKESFNDLMHDTIWLLKKYWIYILAPTMIWGMASATSLAVTAYAEERFLGGAVKCSLMAAFASLGVIIGNALTPKLRPVRYLAVSISSVLMIFSVLSIPIIVEFMHPASNVAKNGHIYWMVAGSIAFLGLFFGIATNLLEAEYLTLVYKEKKEGNGAALLSAGTAFFPFVFGGAMAVAIIKHLANPVTQFILLAIITAASAALTIALGIKKWRESKGHV